jgi:parallel beta-helix repeat protein
MISGVNATQLTASNATITWTTDKTSTSQADYGTTAAYGSSTSPNSSLVTSHAVTLSGLAAGKAYHFRVQSKDTAGNTALSSDYTFTTATATAGNTYYVATTGSDANPGTDALPFHTISYGVSMLTPGDTLYVKSGTYAEALIDNIPGGTSWGAPVTVAAYPGQTVTIRPASGSDYVLHFQGTTQAYIIIDGFIIDGVNITSGSESVRIVSGPGTVETAAHHLRIQNCEIINSPGNGIFVKYAYANEFINLNVHHNGTTKLDHGVYFSASTSGNLVQGSKVYSNAGYGISLHSDSLGGIDNNIIQGNQVYGNGQRGMVLSSGDGNSVYNNIIWGNLRGGITLNNGTAITNTAVYNNTIYANGPDDQLGIYVGSQSVGAVIRNNIVYQNGSGIIDAGANTVSDHNLVDIDPRFVNVAALNFHLQFVSPAVDTGITVSAVTTDFDGIQRPQGAAYDIGAFE